ncbi:hypothetical protein GCM10009555_070160 [Acrocarpospora macrocephala]|uniref:Uncharacterized protein n=1 Tax=Acrocarpospora macrocephala TaxID=150177 RepID=A0A5M3X0E3_9ACTN|nr:hypothetical protein [Acrocarpospora macrocephala]GES13071.1 hypothetical protein Amac_066680 [Acrocarpospora macrocephala]
MRKSALAWIGHPLTVAAVVVLLLNDHLFKGLWPGVVTGKLSDFVGLIAAPALVNLLIRRPWLSILVTGAAFTLVKTTATGAYLASQAWTLVWGPSLVLADPTDLFALPALYAAWWIWNHPDPGAERLARAVVVIPVTVLAVSATGQSEHYRPYSAYAVEVMGDKIVVAIRGYSSSDAYPKAGYVSGDGGRTWYGQSTPLTLNPQTSACVADRCYRIVPGRLKVEESTNGRWVASWEISPGDQDRLARAHPPDLPGDAEAAESLAIAVQQRPDGHVVVVANGADGIAVRDVSGTWRRLGWTMHGFDAAAAVSLSATGKYDDSVSTVALVAALAAGLVTLACGARRLEFGAASLLTWVGICLLSVSRTDPLSHVFLLLLGLGMVPGGIGSMIVTGMQGRIPFRVWAIGAATTAITYFAAMTPVYLWSAGHLDHYSMAVGCSVVLGCATAVVGILTVFHFEYGNIHLK